MSSQWKIFEIAVVFYIMQFEMLQKIVNCSRPGYTNKNYWTLQPSSSYLFKVNNRNTRTRCAICSKLTINTPEQHQLSSVWCLYCKFCTHSTTCPILVLLALNMQLFAGQLSSFYEEIHKEAAMQNCSGK